MWVFFLDMVMVIFQVKLLFRLAAVLRQYGWQLVISIMIVNSTLSLPIMTVTTVGIFIGYGNGSFSTQKTYSTGQNSKPYALAVGDLNNDGRSDIAVANFGTSNVAVLLGYNDSFTSPQTYSTSDPSYPYSVATGDFNADGRLDMVIVNYWSGSIEVFLGNGDGTFSAQTTYSTGSGSALYDVAIGDFNSDNILDFVVVNYGASNIGVFLGDGDVTFSDQMTYSTGTNSYPRSVAIGDFNNDNRLDIVVANTYSYNFGVFLSYGNGTFSSQVTFSTGSGSYPYDVAVGDFNNDSRLDVTIVNYYTDNIGIFLGYGNGAFSNQTTYSTGSGSAPCSVTVSDLNNDYRLDIVVAHLLRRRYRYFYWRWRWQFFQFSNLFNW